MTEHNTPVNCSAAQSRVEQIPPSETLIDLVLDSEWASHNKCDWKIEAGGGHKEQTGEMDSTAHRQETPSKQFPPVDAQQAFEFLKHNQFDHYVYDQTWSFDIEPRMVKSPDNVRAYAYHPALPWLDTYVVVDGEWLRWS